MTSDTTWTLIGFAVGAFLMGLCAVAVLLDHRAQRRAVEEWQARNKSRCDLCGDPGVLHMETHLRLSHGARPTGPEDTW